MPRQLVLGTPWAASSKHYQRYHFTFASRSGGGACLILFEGIMKRKASDAHYIGTRFIENIGVIPDINLDYMTREDHLTRGRPFVQEFTRIINEEIRKQKRP